MDDELLELAENLSKQTSLDGLWQVVCDGLAAMGLQEVSWGHVDPKADPPNGRPIKSTLPSSLWDQYFECGDYEYDPLVNHLLRSDDPFVDHFGWHDLATLTPPGLQHHAELFFENCLPARFAVAERSLGRTKVGILSLGSAIDADRWRAHVDQNMLLYTLAARMCAAYLATAEPPVGPTILSPREAECLTLLARGNRNDRIAEALGLHRATVEMHIARARRKLSAKTREQAIAKAVEMGAIEP